MLGVGGEDAVVSHQIAAWSRHQRREPGKKLDRLEHKMGGARLGYLDDAFALAGNYTPYVDGVPGVLFYFDMAPQRRDPRFMKLAARIGLVDYWTTSGHWPDFCSEPGLPYDCRKEAARLTEE